METTDTYDDWMSRVLGEREGLPLRPDDVVRSSSGEPFKPLEFLRVEGSKFIGEIATKNNDFIYHFYLKEPVEDFDEKLASVFLQIFKYEDRLRAEYAEEVKSWAVKAVGFAANPLSDVMALSIFHALDKKLE